MSELNTSVHDPQSAHARFCAAIQNTQLGTIHGHIRHCSSVDSLLGFTCWLNERVAPTYNDPKYAESNPFGYLAHNTFTNNMMLCHTASLSLERSLYGPCAAVLRPVLESLPKMFYLSYNPGELLRVLAKDRISGIRGRVEQKRELGILRSQNTVHGWFDVDKMIADIKKYNAGYFRQAMYSEETAFRVKRLYQHLSRAVHPDLHNHTYHYNKHTTDKGFQYVEFMLFYNIVMEVDCHMQIEGVAGFPFKESLEFLNRAMADIARDGALLLLPDHPDLADAAGNHVTLARF